jgi:hypothetical protein
MRDVATTLQFEVSPSIDIEAFNSPAALATIVPVACK